MKKQKSSERLLYQCLGWEAHWSSCITFGSSCMYVLEYFLTLDWHKFCLWGRFDIVVNGGGSVTLNFQRPPFVTRQVTILIPWNRIVTIDTVTLMLENESDPAVERCPSGTHDHYATEPVILSLWQHLQLMPCPSTSSVIIQESKVTYLRANS